MVARKFTFAPNNKLAARMEHRLAVCGQRGHGGQVHNLKNVDVRFPVGRLSVITGISGPGKSTLMRSVLRPAVKESLGRVGVSPAGEGVSRSRTSRAGKPQESLFRRDAKTGGRDAHPTRNISGAGLQPAESSAADKMSAGRTGNMPVFRRLKLLGLFRSRAGGGARSLETRSALSAFIRLFVPANAKTRREDSAALYLSSTYSARGVPANRSIQTGRILRGFGRGRMRNPRGRRITGSGIRQT